MIASQGWGSVVFAEVRGLEDYLFCFVNRYSFIGILVANNMISRAGDL